MADNTLRLYETRTVLNKSGFTGSDEYLFQAVTGSRLLVTLLVTAIDLGATVQVYVDNSFASDTTYDLLDTLSLSAMGRSKRVFSDFHNLFKFRVIVTGGNATFKVGVSLFDNALMTTIENAQVGVDVHHTVDSLGRFDSVRIGDGTDLLLIEADGSINIKNVQSSALPDGAATEAKQDAGNALLTQIRDNADQLEGYLDTVEALLAAGNASTASIDGKVSTAANQITTNALLTQIRDNADQLEGYLDTVETLLTNIGNNTDGIEGLITSTNALLTQIRDNADQLEGYLDTVESLLTAGNVSTASIDGKVATAANQATANSLLTTIRDNVDTVETLIAATNTLLTTIRDNADTVETQLTAIQTEIDAAQYTMNEAFSKATAIAGQLDDAAITDATENNVAPVRITPKRAMHANLRNQAGTEIGTDSDPLKVAGNVASGSTDSGNPVKTSGVVNLNGTLFADGQRANTQMDTAGSTYANISGRIPSYSAFATFTVAATATDIFTITGSATKTVKIRSVTVSGTNTGNTNALVIFLKRSTANSGGTSTNLTEVPHDSASAAATATSLSYTVNPTTGTLVGNIYGRLLFLPTIASTNVGTGIEVNYGQDGAQPIVLRGTSEVFAVSLNAVALLGVTVMNIRVDWTEE